MFGSGAAAFKKLDLSKKKKIEYFTICSQPLNESLEMIKLRMSSWIFHTL